MCVRVYIYIFFFTKFDKLIKTRYLGLFFQHTHTDVYMYDVYMYIKKQLCTNRKYNEIKVKH